MRAVFFIWGGFGFFICGIPTFGLFATNATPSTATVIAMLAAIMLWIGGMVLFGLSAILQYLEWRQK